MPARAPATTTTTMMIFALLLAPPACGGEPGTEAEASGESAEAPSESESGSESETGSGEDSWRPEACVDVDTPFFGECHDALIEACRGFASEDDCPDETPLLFEGGYEVYCVWAEVTRISDEASCTVEPSIMRCEAGVVVGAVPCGDPCLIDVPDLYSAFRVVGDEFYRPECSPNDFAIALFAPEGTCAPNIEPPAPSICDCADALCGG